MIKSDRHLGSSPLDGRWYMLHNHVHQSSGTSKELFCDNLQQGPDIHLEHGWLQQDTQTSQGLLESLSVLAQNLRVQLIQRGEDEVNKGPWSLGVFSLSC